MTKVFLIIIAILFVAVVVLFLMWKLSKSENKRVKDELAVTKNQLASAVSQVNKIDETLEIINHNRKETDEKIAALHEGDALGNALNWLSEH